MTYQLPEPKYKGTQANIPNAIPDLFIASQLREAYEQGQQSVVYTDNSAVIAQLESDLTKHRELVLVHFKRFEEDQKAMRLALDAFNRMLSRKPDFVEAAIDALKGRL
jgi:hypothetical protein